MHALLTVLAALGLFAANAYATPTAKIAARDVSSCSAVTTDSQGQTLRLSTVTVDLVSDKAVQAYGWSESNCPVGFYGELQSACAAYSVQSFSCDAAGQDLYHATFTLLPSGLFNTGDAIDNSCVQNAVQAFTGASEPCSVS